MDARPVKRRDTQAFAGVAALYRALHDGVAGDEGNPIFYVTSGPWNRYRLLSIFCASMAFRAAGL